MSQKLFSEQTTKKTAIFTIVSNNYLHFARTMLQSAATQHPDCELFCVIVDKDLTPSMSLENEFKVIGIEELGISDLEAFKFQYTVLELNTAVKPWAMETLLLKGFYEVFYIDPDIYLYQPMREVQDALQLDADIVVTPHLLSPIQDDKHPSELDIRKAGTYNCGFCAVRNCNNTISFLKWWQSKLFRHCIVDFENGIFVDQSWIDLVPGLFDRVYVLRHPGYNVAYWNVAQRPITHDGNKNWQANGEPLIFFHFSGFNLKHPENFSKHQNRFNLSTLGLTAILVDDYRKVLIKNGAEIYAKLPYGFAKFDDGEVIPSGFRRLYLQNEKLRYKLGSNPFANSKSLLWPVDSELNSNSIPLTWAMYLVWLQREDLKKCFPLSDSASIKNFWHWFLIEGSNYYSEAIELEHKRLWLRYEKIKKTQHNSETSMLDQSVNRCHQIFTAMFGHPAGPRGLRYFQKLCGNRVSASLAIFLLALTSKSRQLGKSRSRVESSLSRIWSKKSHKFTLLTDESSVNAFRNSRSLNRELSEGFNLVGYINAELGLGEAARTMAVAAEQAEIPFSLVDVGFQTQNRQDDKREWVGAVDQHFDIDMLYVNADQTSNIIQHLSSINYDSASYRIGYWHWEQTNLPSAFMNGFEGLDEIWVPTTFVHEAISKVSPLPVFKVPHAVEFAVSKKWTREFFNIPAQTFAVLVMYDFHSYRYRKNPEAAISAFKQASQGRHDVSLIIKTMNASHYQDDYLALKDDLEGFPNVLFIDDVYTREQIYGLEACCDCMLSLHRAEGFGFGPAEMMYLAKPVIATGWSGNMDFMTSKNSFPVDYELVPLEKSVGVYEAGCEWAEPDIEHAAKCLKSLISEPSLARDIGLRARDTMLTKHSAMTIGKQYKERFEIIKSMYSL